MSSEIALSPGKGNVVFSSVDEPDAKQKKVKGKKRWRAEPYTLYFIEVYCATL